MELTAGAKLGPYDILSPLGAGGMGEVWKARDPRLGREVAIKILPPSVCNDPDRLARFEMEAKAAPAPSITPAFSPSTTSARKMAPSTSSPNGAMATIFANRAPNPCASKST